MSHSETNHRVMRRGSALLSVARSVEQISRVVACGLTPLQRARLIDATRSRAAIVGTSTPAELYATLEGAVDPVDVVAMGPQSDGRQLHAIIRRLRVERPRLPVIVYLATSGHQTSTIPELTQAGAHEIIIPGFNDQGDRLLAAMSSARRGCTERWIMARLSIVVPPRLMPFAEAIIAEPVEIENVPALAARVGVHRKTLYNWCESMRFVQPREFLLWCRLVLVAHYLETTRCTVDTIARDVGFPSPTALRNTLKRYTGLTASQLRDAGGLERFVEIFGAEVSRVRAKETSLRTDV